MNLNFPKKITAAFLTLCMLISSAPAILAAGDETEPQNGENATTQQPEETLTATDTAEPDKDLIEYANGLANATQANLSSDRKTATFKNNTMSLDYDLRGNSGTTFVSNMTNTKGQSYLTDTMDVFVEMTGGNKFYASQSFDSASLNIYRYGYYYYENRLEGQGFVSGNVTEAASFDITHTSYDTKSDIENIKTSNGILSFNQTAGGVDPYIGYTFTGGLFNYKDTQYKNLTAENYDYLSITFTPQSGSGFQLFLWAGDNYTSFNEVQSCHVPYYAGEEQTIVIPLSKIKDCTGRIKGARFDMSGAVSISDIHFFKAEDAGISSSISIQRSFLTYSDKLHHLTQIVTSKEVTGVASVGMETKLAENTVSKLIVKDKNGLHTSLSGIDWASAEYVGFDVAEAGIFGYILPADGKSGTMTVTEADGYYVITQTLPIESGKFIPSEEGTLNGNDVFFGQRIYNDENHDFAAFINEAECERNPLTKANIVVDANSNNSADFIGYDYLYGFYTFRVTATGFQTAYDNQNLRFNVRFHVKGDEYNRKMYFMTRGIEHGCIECAALLNEDDMLLPVPIEVAKNFAGDGENTIYNIDDACYSEAFFPMIVNSGEVRTYNIVNLYQNWGKFPLKQISSIQFHTPYYHLSTGTTESNCIQLLPVNGPSLPDHRAMSAPFWPNQPQHNSGGIHEFLTYTDASGKVVTTQNTQATIDSYGPTYCDITLDYVTSDGKITSSYTHTEMPQTDENRAFYEMTYTVHDTVTINDFKNDFNFYKVTDNNSTGYYSKIGYLDINNNCTVVDALTKSGSPKQYVLGNYYPYFSFFMMPNWNQKPDDAYGYTNLSMLFKDWAIVRADGTVEKPEIIITNTFPYIEVSFNLGKVTLNKGDKIYINAILMPWGSQQMEDDDNNRLHSAETENFSSPHYSDKLDDGSLYMDKNVRDVRINTIINEMKATAVADCTVINTNFVPKVKTTNGKSAEFTLLGGNNNITTRVYGFNKLTVPKVYEKIDGEWVEYELSSKNSPDAMGNAYNYDGYTVHYDADGTYSYTFVAAMDNGKARTFKIVAEDSFEGWDFEADADLDPMNIYVDAKTIYNKAKSSTNLFSNAVLSEDGSYVSLYGKGVEAFVNAYKPEGNGANVASGKYIVYKYRLPETNTTDLKSIQFWTSTERTGASGDYRDYITVAGNAVQNDGNWHVIVIDVTEAKDNTAVFSPTDNGSYAANYLRVDIINDVPYLDENSCVDVAYIGMSDSIAEIIAANPDVDYISLGKGQNMITEVTQISTKNATAGENAANITVSGATALVGNQVTVTVSLSDNKGVSQLSLIPKYDTSVLTLKEVKNGNVFDYIGTSDGRISWNSYDTNTKNGDLAYLTFEINEDAADGSYPIEITVVDSSSADGSAPEFNVKNSAISLFQTGSTYGDCDGDGTVTTYDIVLLRKYLVSYDYESGTSDVSVPSGADVNQDGEINTVDLTILRQYLANYNYETGESTVVLGKIWQ